MSNITKENTFESYNNVDLNKRLESVSNTDIKTINTYWNNILTANEKIVNTQENKSDIQRNAVGILEASAKNETNTVFIPFVGLVANDTDSYFQTFETDFSFFEFDAKVRTTSATTASAPQTLVITTYENASNKPKNADILFFAPAFNGGTKILRYEYALRADAPPDAFQPINVGNGNVIVSYENEIINDTDKDFRYIFSFNPDTLNINTKYFLRIRAVTDVGPGRVLDGTFTTGQAATLTTGVPNPVKQKR
jgi:hypothetical protein